MDVFFDRYLWYFLFLGVFEFFLITQKRQYCSEHPGLAYEDAHDYRCGTIFAILTFLPLFLISSFRDQWYADTTAYVWMFERWPNAIGEVFLTGSERYPGFIYFSVFIKQFISKDFRVWLVIIAAISVFCMVITFKKYTSEIVFCAFLFFSSTECQSWLMNGMRQFLVVSIIFCMTPLLLSKNKTNYFLFILVGLLLYTFHTSVIIAVPIFFFALGEPFNKKTLLILAGALLAVLFLGNFISIFNDVVSETNYASSVNEMTGDQTIGTNFFRVLVYSVPGMLAIFFRKKIPEDVPDIIKFSINMSIVTIAFYVVSMFTSGIFFGRMPIYFSLFNYILLPWEINTFFEKNNSKLVYIFTIITYLVYYLYWIFIKL